MLGEPAGHSDMVGVVVRHDDPADPAPAELGGEDLLPGRLGFRQREPGIDRGPGGPVFEQPQIDVVEREGQLHAQPQHAWRDRDDCAGRGRRRDWKMQRVSHRVQDPELTGDGGPCRNEAQAYCPPVSLAFGGRFDDSRGLMRDFNAPGRSAAVAANGMVATSAPMATLAGLEILRAGGNAMDAAIAAVAMQCVVEPASTGIGGDCFVLYSKKGALPVALNGSGRAPAAATVDWFLDRQIDQIHTQTPHAVTIPGAVDAWCLLNREHGTTPLSELLEPAARAADDGYRVTPRVSWDWHRNQWKLQDLHTAKVMRPGGKPPAVGDRMRNPLLAATLRRIGRDGRAAFYEGAVMRDILGRLKELGGLHEEADFDAQRADWVEPIHAPYRGHEVYELPPNGQGLAALMILRQLAGFAMGEDSLSEADRLHLLAVATKQAYRVRDEFIADPSQVDVDVAGFLSDAW